MTIEIGDTEISTWFERDRACVALMTKGGAGDIIEWWDEAVSEAITDGFLDPKDYHGSAFKYAAEHGLLEPGAKPLKITPTPKAWAAGTAELGIYCGWSRGGAPIWSSDATEEQAARGAYTFSSEDEARRLFEDDGTENGVFALVELDIKEPNRHEATRASFESCEIAGLTTAREATAAPAGP